MVIQIFYIIKLLLANILVLMFALASLDFNSLVCMTPTFVSVELLISLMYKCTPRLQCTVFNFLISVTCERISLTRHEHVGVRLAISIGLYE